MQVVFHPHAEERLGERGVSREEAIATVTTGERLPAKFGRAAFRRVFGFGKMWRGKTYAAKQVEVIVVEEPHRVVILTVVARYF